MESSRRLQRELRSLMESPPEGCVVFPVGDSIQELEAQLQPVADTPYSGGLFRLSIVCSARYPNEPPNVRFLTPVYHPNIDSEGRICLNILKMPPNGIWSPAYNVAAVLSAVQILLAQPNPDDPLMTDITEEYRTDYEAFARKARAATQKYAATTTTNESAKVQQKQPEKQEQEPERGKKKARVEEEADEREETAAKTNDDADATSKATNGASVVLEIPSPANLVFKKIRL